MTKRTIIQKFRKKRCMNGTRRNRITGFCEKYGGFTVFDNLKDQKIVDKGISLAIESLDKEGAIIKVYNNGLLQYQQLIEMKFLKQAGKDGIRDLKHILKQVRKIKKNPDIIKKDLQYQLFKKNKESLSKEKIIRGGNGHGIPEKQDKQEKVNLTVDKKVLENAEPDDNNIKDLQRKLNVYQARIDLGKVNSKLNNTNQQLKYNWFSYFFMSNLLSVGAAWITSFFVAPVSSLRDQPEPIPESEPLTPSQEASDILIEAVEIILKPIEWLWSGLVWLGEGFYNGITTERNEEIEGILDYDIYFGICLAILDCVVIRFSNETFSIILEIVQYIFWTWIATTTVITTGLFNITMIPVIIGSVYMIWQRINAHFDKNSKKLEFQKEVLKTKIQLAEEIEFYKNYK